MKIIISKDKNGKQTVKYKAADMFIFDRTGEIIPKLVKDNSTGKFVEGYWN